MAAHDAEAFIAEAVQSVLEQTYDDWELIVVDDGSRDRTNEIATEFSDPRIRVERIEHLGVLGAVRNVGIEVAGGDSVGFLDADDVWLPRKLEVQVRMLEQQPEVGVVAAHADVLIDGERRPGPHLRRGPLMARLLEGNFITSSSCLVRRTVLRDHGVFDSDPALGGSPDYELWLRLASRTEFAFVHETLLLYRMHGAQMSTDDQAMQRSALVALEKLAERDPEVVHRHAAAYAFGVGVRRQLGELPGAGRRELLRALLLRPWSLRAWRWLLRSFVLQRPASSA